MTRAHPGTIKRVMWPLDPVPGESLMGFVGRVAAHNVIDDTLSITRQAGQTFGHRTSLVYSTEADLETLGVALRVDTAELRARAHPPLDEAGSRFFGLRVPAVHIETKARRFSPTSLAVRAYHRGVWQYRPLPFCRESWEFLTDRCGVCGEVQRWYHAQGPERCDICGHSLAETPGAVIAEGARDHLSFVADLVDPIGENRSRAMDRVPPALASLRPEHVLELVIHLGHLTAPGGFKGRRDKTWRNDPAAQAEMLRASAELVLGWPDKPLELISGHLAARRGSRNDATLHRISSFFRALYLDPLPPETQDAVKGLRASINRSANKYLAGTTPLTLHQSATVCGLSKPELAEHRRRGRLRSVPLVGRVGKLIAGFDETEIRWLGEAVRTCVSSSSIASVLGISLHGVEQLTCLDLIAPIHHPVFATRYDRAQFEAASARALYERIRAAADPFVTGVPLRKIVQAIPGPKPWGPIVASMLQGLLPFGLGKDDCLITSALVPAKYAPFVEGLHFHKSHYPDFVFDEVMSQRDALDGLNLPINRGAFLKPGIVERAKPRDYRIVRTDFVERTAREFVTLQELRARTGLRPSQIQAAMSPVRVGQLTAFGWPRHAAEIALLGPSS